MQCRPAVFLLVCTGSLSDSASPVMSPHYFQTNLPIPPVSLNKVDKEQMPVCECSPSVGSPCGEDDVSVTFCLLLSRSG